MMAVLNNVVDSPVMHRIIQWMLPYRLLINIVIHTMLIVTSYFYSLLFFNGLLLDRYLVDMFVVTVWPLLLIRLAVFHYYGLFTGMWRFVSLGDVVKIIHAVIISTLLVYGLSLVWDRIFIAGQVYLLDMMFCGMLCSGIRLLVRNFREVHLVGGSMRNRKRILLLGPVFRIQPILKDITTDPKAAYWPVAIIDPEESDRSDGGRIADVTVLSLGHFKKQYRGMGLLDSVIICWPGATRRQINDVVEQLRFLKVTFKIIPHFGEIMDGRVSIKNLRHVEIEDLLGREPVQIELDRIRAFLKGKAVLVTGGAGSIGSEICRQVAGSEPRRLVILDRAENSLYDFEREIRGRYPDVPIHSRIASVNDAAGLAHLMRVHRIDVVFHAAAYKHVPLMESVPIESAYNNIIGTHNTARAARQAGVKRFVMISTDKAVNPTNVMGVTKRIAEMCVQSMDDPAGTRFMTVRFGNVLGSAGSVVPIFKRQIETGGPISVTHPNIERFFMTIPEAVQLVLQAGWMAKGGEIFVLDMGEPVKIMDLAEKLITLSGMQPHEDIAIEFTGLRPGEKMYEELFNASEILMPTRHPRIRTAQCAPVDRNRMAAEIAVMKTVIQRKDETALLNRFVELVPGYRCQRLNDPTCQDPDIGNTGAAGRLADGRRNRELPN